VFSMLTIVQVFGYDDPTTFYGESHHGKPAYQGHTDPV
jgi:hypothetical protein